MSQADGAEPFIRRYFQVARREIAYLRFILESYDGLAFMRTIDRQVGLIEISAPAQRQQQAWALVAALSEETGLTEVAAPRELPPL
ncbi:MAG: DUF4911 domain-containing protein [Desulfuromonas sp.]|nr:MAG: DUF4911 domain-containing protein [Desulfuromonas sp.]